MKKIGWLILLSVIILPCLSTAAPAKFNPVGYTVSLVGHAHIDLSWLWRWEETLRDGP